MRVRRVDFRQVRPTEDELATWRTKNPRRAAPVRAEHLPCGQRIWYSGIAIGSHTKACPGARNGRCEALARKGTGTGVCDRPLDDHGQCDRASDHQEDS
jgi:hypothetical protein